MARYYSANEAASMVCDEDIVESGDESDIEEDPSFPLPCNQDSLVESEQPHPSPFTCTRSDAHEDQLQPLPQSASAHEPIQPLSVELELNPDTGTLQSIDENSEGAYL